jgi:phosphatidylserine/phosphatidylglycerophosphate/cardiolipin synthase-like enzyme
MKTLRIISASLIVAGLLSTSFVGAAISQADEATTPLVETTFTDPLAHSGKDRAIINQAVRLINDAPEGANVLIGLHSLTIAEVSNAIKDAHSRGVVVKVVYDGKKWDDTYQKAKTLNETLGDANVKKCGNNSSGGGCLSNSSSGYMHMKYMLLSQTKDSTGKLRDNVVWVSSANMTEATGTEAYNNAVTTYDDRELFLGYVRHVWYPQACGKAFDPANPTLHDEDYACDLTADSSRPSYSGNDYYSKSKPRGYFSSAAIGTTVFVSPEQSTDQIVTQLDTIQDENQCTVLVLHASFNDSRSAVADKLVWLAKEKAVKCQVRVLTTDIDSAQKKKLTAAGITNKKLKTQIHDKVIIVTEWNSKEISRWVLYGSQNLTGQSMTAQDNLLIRTSGNDALHQGFRDHFYAAWSAVDSTTGPIPEPDPIESDADEPETVEPEVENPETVEPRVFTDVPTSNMFYGDINYLNVNGFIPGTDTEYRPEASLTRLEAAAFLYLVAGQPEFTAPESPTFPDVAADHPYFTEIEWAKAQSIINGVGGEFQETRPVTRAEMMVYLYRLAGKPAVSGSATSFSDIQGHAHAYAIEWAASQGIASTSNPTFKPNNEVTRAETAAFLARYLHNGVGV